MSNDILFFQNGGGYAPSSLGFQTASVALAPGQPLMLTATGYAPNNGSAPIAGYAPIGGVSVGGNYIPQDANNATIPGSNFTPGLDYYLQANGTLSTTVTTRYAGTAVTPSALTVIPEKSAAAVSIANTAATIAQAVEDAKPRIIGVTPLVEQNGFVFSGGANVRVGTHAVVLRILGTAPTTVPASGTVVTTMPATVGRIEGFITNQRDSKVIMFADASLNIQVYGSNLTADAPLDIYHVFPIIDAV